MRAKSERSVIRQATIDDIEPIRRILLETWHATYGSFIPAGDINGYFERKYSFDALKERLARADTRILVAERDAECRAVMITTVVPASHRLYIASLYVLPSEQGQGTGNALLASADDLARQQGCTEEWLGVMKQNTRAREWYVRHGFRFVTEEPFVMETTPVMHLLGWRPVKPRENR